MSTTSSTTNPTSPFPYVRHIADPDLPLILRASDHQPAPIKWLWPNRIPLGSITLLAGDPGAGKSLFALDLASRISTGAPWPDETPPPPQPTACGLAPPHSDEMTKDECPMTKEPPFVIRHSETRHSPPGSVLILSASDDFHDTILPRLSAAGADPSRVCALSNITNLRTEFEKLRLAINDLPDLKLLILDPINFYVGPGDAHFQTVVRTVLEPLAQLARQRGFAILAITHFRKNDGAALQRAAGSMAFVATARTIWTITPDADDSSRRYLVPLKNNLTAPTPALAFHITSTDPQSPHLTWDPIAACGLAHRSQTQKPTPPTLRDEAQHFLTEALAAGPRPASELIEEADRRGLTRRTVQRAFHDLAGHTSKRGFLAGWWWSLGEYPIAPIPKLPLAYCENPLAVPTYALDVADQISAQRMHAVIEHRIATEAPSVPAPRPPRKNVSPSRRLAPSQNSAETPRPSPRPPMSSSPLRPRFPGPLSAFLQHLTRPRGESDRPCTEPPPHQEP